MSLQSREPVSGLGRWLRRSPAILAIGLLIYLALAAPAEGNHAIGASYVGTHAEHGPFRFSTSGDGTTLDSLAWGDIWGTSPSGGWCNSGLGINFFYGAPPITDHTFNYSGDEASVSGSFPNPGTASGTIQVHTKGPPPDGFRLPCNSSSLAWTAATGSVTVARPPPATTTQQFTYPAGATYKGTHAQGDGLEFDVSLDGSQIVYVEASSLQGDNCQISGSYSASFNPGEGPVINGGAWDYSGTQAGATLTFRGSFGTGPTASGTITVSFQDFNCTAGPVAWTAVSGPPDETAPTLTLGGALSQAAARNKGVNVEATCPSEPCTVSAGGTVTVPKAAKVYRFKRVTMPLAQGVKATLKLKLSGKASTAIGRALSKGKKLKAKIQVTATDAAGNTTTTPRTIKLKK